MKRGRPLRFLAGVLGGWTLLRVAMLWPAEEEGVMIERVASPTPSASPGKPMGVKIAVPTTESAPFQLVAQDAARRMPSSATPHLVKPATEVPVAIPIQSSGDMPEGTVKREWDESPPASLIMSNISQPPRSLSRWSGSAWALVRDARGLGVAPGAGQIGGSQAGVRLFYALDSTGRTAAYARAAGALAAPDRELAFGVEWRPTGLPVRLIAERRMALDGGEGGFGAGLIGGVDAVLGRGVELHGYAQAGAVARGRIDGYADGGARLVRPLPLGAVRVEPGIGGWGAAQREAARLEVGPSISLVLPVSRRSIRLTLDWRQRVAGDGRPGSGPVLTLGSDF